MKKRCSIMVAMLVAVAGWIEASVVEKPAVMQDAMVTLTVSDLHGFIDGVGAIAEQVAPMASGPMIKSLAGMQLGDPGLAGIASGKGLAVVALDQTNVFAVVEVSEAQAGTYTAALSKSGLSSRYADGVLIVAGDAALVETGAAQAAKVRQTLLARRSPALSVVAQPASLIEKNDGQIEGMMQMMPMMMTMGMAQAPGMDPAGIEPVMRILEGEIRVLLSLAKQCDIVEVVLAPQDGALRINETLVPLAGTRLATLLHAPRVTTPNPRVQAGMLGDAALAIDCTLANPQALTDFICEEMDLVLREMGVESESVTKANETLKKWAGLYNGSFSENVDIGGDHFMNVTYVLDIKSEADVITMFKGVEQDAAPFLELYKSFGMPISIKFMENVREHSGVKIHQFRVGMTLPGEPAAAAGAMKTDLTNMVYDVAVCDGLLLYAMGDTKVETLLDRMKDGDFKAAPLKARSVYPADGIYYCDLDVARYLKGISSILPADPSNPLPQLAAMLTGADPVTASAFRENGMVMWSANIPGSLLAKVGQASMAMQMQQMQQAPQAVAPEVPNSGAEAVPAP